MSIRVKPICPQLQILKCTGACASTLRFRTRGVIRTLTYDELMRVSVHTYVFHVCLDKRLKCEVLTNLFTSIRLISFPLPPYFVVRAYIHRETRRGEQKKTSETNGRRMHMAQVARNIGNMSAIPL